MPKLQAVFLDRDGTLNRERADYVKSWREFEWLPGALDALAVLASLDVPVLVVTNQSALGRGILDPSALHAIHAQARAEALAAGGRMDDFLICPHAPADGCTCRKPKPGLLLQAAARYNLDLQSCVFVGDSLTDMQAAEAAGCGWLLVRTGRQGTTLDFAVDAALASLRTDQGLESSTRGSVETAYARVVDDLAAAAELLAAAAVEHEQPEKSFE
jgi:D-glycero-D-manno-heptose 1,7-bisphosphate phosphatase